MNRIVLANNVITSINLSKAITYEFKEELINKLKLKINKDTSLEIIINNDFDTKLDFQIELDTNVKCVLTSIITGEKTKILSKYSLKENSYLKLIKINDVMTINQRDIVNLNGQKANIDYILKTISKNNEKYDLVINHNASKTTSNLFNHGVNILKGSLCFNITTYVTNGHKDCLANQNNRIINLTDNNCTIRPNLLIDEVDVIANHSALIGAFKDSELFYMQRLGLDKITANQLLIKGFINSKIDNKKLIDKIFSKYWR
ncbi:MAG: SufD family Fe-S cluster assembly protein [Bacilli bacterium]